MLVRREAAEQVGWLDPEFFVYSDETDFCKRLGDAGWRILYVPSARAVHHDQMAQDAAGAERRTVEYHRNRDRYLRKHSGRVEPPSCCGRCSPGPTCCAPSPPLFLPGHSPGATGCTRARRSSRAAARASARRPRRYNRALGS